MASTYYVDDGQNVGGGGDVGTSANPWLNTSGLQLAFDTAIAGDTVYIRGTYMLNNTGNDDRGVGAVTINVDINVGDSALGTPITYIGIEAGDSWVENGTRTKLDGGGAGGAVNCLSFDSMYDLTFRNFELDRSIGSNAVCITNHAYGIAFINCYSHDAVISGWGDSIAGLKRFYDSIFFGCQANGNAFGYTSTGRCMFIGCSAIDNSAYGFFPTSGPSAHIVCLAHDCGTAGFRLAPCQVAAFCVMDGQQYGLYGTDGPILAFGNRLTNNTTRAIYMDTAYIIDLFNYFAGNTGISVGVKLASLYKGVNTEVIGATDGYEDKVNHKFGLLLGAGELRSEVAMDDAGNNVLRFARGLPSMWLPRIGKAGGKQ